MKGLEWVHFGMDVQSPYYVRCACSRSSFKDVGKGWFNLSEANHETYEFSKLKRFLQLVRFGMEDTIRFLTEHSMEKFLAFMEVCYTGHHSTHLMCCLWQL